MNTFVLNAQTMNLPIGQLLTQVGDGGVEVRDDAGKVVAFLLSPTDREAWTYAEANLDLSQNAAEVRQALGRRSGVTAAQLLQNAIAAAANAAAQ